MNTLLEFEKNVIAAGKCARLTCSVYMEANLIHLIDNILCAHEHRYYDERYRQTKFFCNGVKEVQLKMIKTCLTMNIDSIYNVKIMANK